MTRQIFVAVVFSIIVTLAAASLLNRPAALAQSKNANGEKLWDYATLRTAGGELVWHDGKTLQARRVALVLKAIGGKPTDPKNDRTADPVFAAGRQGWELVSAQDVGGSEVFWFKRPAR